MLSKLTGETMPEHSESEPPQAVVRASITKTVFGQIPTRLQLITIVLLGIILVCMLTIIVLHFSVTTGFVGFADEIIVALIANLLFTIVLAILLWLIVQLIHRRDQNNIGSVFGVDELHPEMTVFLSNMYIEPNGTRALEEIEGGYRGSAVCRVEYQAAIRIRELVEKISVLNMPKQLYDYLGRTALGFQQLKVTIHLSRLPSSKHRRSRPRTVSHTTVDGTSAKISPIINGNEVHVQDDAVTSTAGVQIQSEKGVVAETRLTRGTQAILNPDGSSDVIATTIEGSYYDWSSYRKEKFWLKELGPCQSIISIGSNIYNSITRYYTDTYFNEHRQKYDCFPTFVTTESAPFRGIELWRNSTQNRPSEPYLRRPGTLMEPAFIARFVDLGLVEGQITSDRDQQQFARTVFICAGISHVATAASVKYLIHNWKRIKEDYDQEDFFLPLWVDVSGKEPDHFDKINMPQASRDLIYLRRSTSERP